MGNQFFTVVGSTDDNYAKPLAMVFNSILRHTDKKELIDLVCIDGGISNENKEFITDAVKKEGGNVRFLDVDTSDYDDIKTIKHITKAAFYRISIPSIIDKSIDRVLYLDCDILVRDDVTRLWDIDLEKYDVAAVENISSRVHLKTGLKQSEYFNSGVLMMNLTRWRKENIAAKVVAFKKNNPDKISTNDQCAINCVVNGSWYRLPLKWNHQTGLYRNKNIRRRYSAEEIQEAINNPSIVHFIGEDKPWKKNSYHPWASCYISQTYYLLNETERNDFIEETNHFELFLVSLRSIKLLRKYLRTRMQYFGVEAKK